MTGNAGGDRALDLAAIRDRLYRRQKQGALFRATASASMWLFNLFAYHLGALRLRPFLGITVCVGLLIFLTWPLLYDIRRLKDVRAMTIHSLLANGFEAVLYTAIIHFLGGVEGALLTSLYCILIMYLGMVAASWFSYLITGWCSVCFVTLVALEHYGLLPHYPLLVNLPLDFRPPWPNELCTVLAVPGLLFLVAYISAATARLRHRDRVKLRRQNLELERNVSERTAALLRVNEHLRAEIEERARAEEALRQSEEKYRNILESIEDGYYEVDLAGNLTSFNQSLCRILGRGFEELRGLNNRDFMDPETASQVYRAFNEVYRTGRASRGFSWAPVRKDGRQVFVETSVTLVRDARGEPVGFRGICRDVTERRLMEAELIEARDRLQSIFDSSTDGLVTTDRHGTLLTVSPRIRDILGYTPEEVLGRKVHFLYQGGREEAQAIMARLEALGEIKNRESTLVRKDGAPVIVSLSAAILRDHRGRAVGTLGVYRDITEAKKLEARLQQAQKFEAIGTLAGGLAHDFNNLLMAIQGSVSLLLLRTGLEDAVQTGLKNIERQVASGARLTSQLLGYARKGTYELRPTDLGRVVLETSETFGRARRQITIRRDLRPGLWPVEADRGQIEQVLLNLYVNAADAMPEGGELTLSARNVTGEEIRDLGYDARPGRYVELMVSDTGTGMDAATKARIFDPFFTTKEMGRGTGLGLASSYGIIRAHAGYIEVESAPGAGATFRLYLPASARDAPSPPADEPPLLPGRETILIVDDEETVLEVWAELLDELGYRVLKAANGEAALETYAAQGGAIDLVVLDLIMPGLGGGEVYDRLKAMNPGVRVLLASGYSLDGEAEEILRRGCDGFIQKPFNLEQFSRKAREVLERGRFGSGA
ncbi:MAG: PAS domain S-box protein [Thermodesulfobacteriota bacterium]